MSDFNEDEFEEIDESEEQEQKNNEPKTLEQPKEEVIEEKRPNNLQAINVRRMINKKANSIRFFLHFAAFPYKTFDEIANDVGITKSVAQKYLDEYASVVINSLEAGTYPTGVVTYYNDASIPKAQRLTVKHIQELKPVLIRYKKINIDSMLGEQQQEEEEEEEEQEISNDILDDVLKPISQEKSGKFKKYNEFMENQQAVNTNPRVINSDSPIQDVIEFGLINSGAPDSAKIRRIKTLFMSSPNFYLADEGRFKDLLISNDIKDKALSTFMDWFKYVAPIKPSERVGFLNLTNSKVNESSGQFSAAKKFKNFSIDDYDDFAQYLYHEGVFRYGLPPEHQVNQEAYKQYQAKKQMEAEEQQTMRQFNLMTKKMILDMQTKALGGGQAGGNISGPALDERLLFERGMVAPEITYTEDGKRVVRWLPTGKTLYDSQQMQQQQQQQTGGPNDAMMQSVTMFSRLIEAIRPMMQPQTQPQNPLLDKMLTIMLEKSLNKVEETPSKVLENQMSLFTQFKQFFPQQETRAVDPTTMQLQLELAKINQDGKMAEREIEIKEKMWNLEQQRLEEQKHESKDNISMIMEWVTKGFQYLSPVIQSLIMGQMGGGLSSMMPGMIPGGNGGGSMVPEQPSPFIPQDTGIIEDNPGGIPQNIPPEFLPQNEMEEVVPRYAPIPETQPQYQIPQETQPQPQQFEPAPQIQTAENNFIDSISNEDLHTLDLTQLHDVESRIDLKLKKIEKLLNTIKSVKVKKQMGYDSIDKYKALDVPADIPPDFDGVKEEAVKEEQQQQSSPLEDLTTNFDSYDFPTTLNYNNDYYSIDDMGNDNQQFNQQNKVNQKEFIEEQEQKRIAKEKSDKLAHLQSIGCTDANINNVHLFDDKGKKIVVDTTTSTDSLNDPANPANRDINNDDSNLDKTKTQPSKQFQEKQQNKNNKKVSEKEEVDDSDNSDDVKKTTSVKSSTATESKTIKH